MTKPKIAFIPGDPSGIGPELVARLLAEPETRERADMLLIGDRALFELGMEQSGLPFTLSPTTVDAFAAGERPDEGFPWIETETIDPDEIRIAEVTEASGRSALANLDMALDLTRDGVTQAVLFAPFNKASMHLGGLTHDDELHHIGERLGVETYLSELNALGNLWTSRVTSHVALKDVAGIITERSHRIDQAVELIENTLKRSGMERPRIAVAALNPHAGDNGNFGREEIDTIIPAVERMRERQVAVSGPWPSDTVFLKAKAGEIDGVVTMYHDQGQIALKLMGFDRGVTVQGGLPFPVTTPAHGTAFDIAGQGKADVGATRAAFDIACRMVSNWAER